jgi:hypothetical protein
MPHTQCLRLFFGTSYGGADGRAQALPVFAPRVPRSANPSALPPYFAVWRQSFNGTLEAIMANTLTSSGGAAVALTFESTTFEVVDQQGQQWLKSGQIAQALGYADETAITKLYSRRKDEFTNSMSQTVNLTVQGQMRETRIFSLRGAHLLAMFARTAIAKLFRIWVLDLIESSAFQPPSPPPNANTCASWCNWWLSPASRTTAKHGTGCTAR